MNKNFIPNSTQIPNIFFDTFLHTLEPSQFKVLLYIARRTYGFRKKLDRISLSQFTDGIKTRDGKVLDGGTGLSKQGVINALKTLEEVGLLVVERKNNSNLYGINLNADPEKVVNSLDQSTHLTTTSQLSVPEVVNSVDTQYTREIQVNNIPAKAGAEFNFKEELEKLRSNKRKDFKIIAHYWSSKCWNFDNLQQFSRSLRRELRAAKDLEGYSGEQIGKAITYCKKEYPDKWTLETVFKRIQDLVNKKT